jgi:hypothetical protein
LLTPQSWAWSKDYQTQYLLGDNDSRLSAKQHALAQIQLQAAQEAGTYIQGSTRLINDQLEERIHQESAAVVTVEVLSERFELAANGQQKLYLAAKANVDESVLKERVRSLQIDAIKVEDMQKIVQDNGKMRQQLEAIVQQRQSQQPLLSVIEAQQQKLAADNQKLREQLQALAQQRIVSTANTQVATVVNLPTPAADDIDSWLSRLFQQWQQTPIQSKVLSKQLSDDGQFYDLAVQVDWQLSLAAGSPLAELCQRWTCELGYAYKASFNDANLTLLHQKMFRPLSRLAHMDDKYINHWQLLTVQAYPPNNLTVAEQQNMAQFFASHRLSVNATVAYQSIDLPLVQYDAEQGALIIRLKGDMNSFNTSTYDSATRTGSFICAMAYSKRSCVGAELSQLVLRKIRVDALQQPLALKGNVVAF